MKRKDEIDYRVDNFIGDLYKAEEQGQDIYDSDVIAKVLEKFLRGELK